MFLTPFDTLLRLEITITMKSLKYQKYAYTPVKRFVKGFLSYSFIFMTFNRKFEFKKLVIRVLN